MSRGITFLITYHCVSTMVFSTLFLKYCIISIFELAVDPVLAVIIIRCASTIGQFYADLSKFGCDMFAPCEMFVDVQAVVFYIVCLR